MFINLAVVFSSLFERTFGRTFSHINSCSSNNAFIVYFFLQIIYPSYCTWVVYKEINTNHTSSTLAYFGGLDYPWYKKSSGCQESHSPPDSTHTPGIQRETPKQTINRRHYNLLLKPGDGDLGWLRWA